jgi:hypothetical protein
MLLLTLLACAFICFDPPETPAKDGPPKALEQIASKIRASNADILQIDQTIRRNRRKQLSPNSMILNFREIELLGRERKKKLVTREAHIEELRNLKVQRSEQDFSKLAIQHERLARTLKAISDQVSADRKEEVPRTTAEMDAMEDDRFVVTAEKDLVELLMIKHRPYYFFAK